MGVTGCCYWDDGVDSSDNMFDTNALQDRGCKGLGRSDDSCTVGSCPAFNDCECDGGMDCTAYIILWILGALMMVIGSVFGCIWCCCTAPGQCCGPAMTGGQVGMVVQGGGQ